MISTPEMCFQFSTRVLVVVVVVFFNGFNYFTRLMTHSIYTHDKGLRLNSNVLEIRTLPYKVHYDPKKK